MTHLFSSTATDGYDMDRDIKMGCYWLVQSAELFPNLFTKLNDLDLDIHRRPASIIIGKKYALIEA